MFMKSFVLFSALVSFNALAAAEVYRADFQGLSSELREMAEEECLAGFTVAPGGDVAAALLAHSGAGAKVTAIQKSKWSRNDQDVLTKVYLIQTKPFADSYPMGIVTRLETEIVSRGGKRSEVKLMLEAVNHRESAEIAESLVCDGLVYKRL